MAAQYGPHRWSAGYHDNGDNDAFRAADFTVADLTGARFVDCDMTGVKIVDSWLVGVDISGFIHTFVINGVDVTDYVNAALTADRRAAVLAMVEDGLLLPWDRWFAPEAIAELLPDKAVRQRFRDELRGLPAGLLSEPMPQSPWDDRVAKAYVQLSAAYAAIADQAEAAGWLVARYSMDHLAPLTRSREVAEAIAESIAAARAATAGQCPAQ